ncbi:MAG TPA: Calx-beta domain-containing protein, partial [Candidatus Acidoferrum sp.]|nr:Calx-beta domain-containing protein [Candidatus Acidoferrum sp.]
MDMAVQPDSKTIIVGDFDHYNTFTRNHIARLNIDGSLDVTFNPGTGADGIVEALVLYGTNSLHAGKAIIGGAFRSYNNNASGRNGIARINSDGSIDASFNPGNGFDGIVRALVLQNDDKVIVAGDFGMFNDVNVNNIIRLNANGTLDPTFNPGAGPDSVVWALAVDESGLDRQIYAGGDFTEFDSTPRSGITRLLDDGTVDFSFDPGLGADNSIYAIGIQENGKVLIAGAFNMYHTFERGSLARLNLDGTLDESYSVGTGADDSIYALTLQQDGKALIGGVFTSYNGTRRMGLARIFTSGALDTSFMDTAYNQFAGLPRAFSFDNPSFVNVIALQPDGNVMIGGSFTNVGGNLSIHYPYATNTFDIITNSAGFLFTNVYQSISGRTSGHNSGGHLFAPFTRQDKTTRFNVARVIGGYTPGPGNLEFDPGSIPFTVNEGNGSVAVTLRRVDGRLGTVQVSPTTTNNTAQFPVDFSANINTQVWSEYNGTTNGVPTTSPRSVGYVGNQYFYVPITQDAFREGDETFGLVLSNTVGSITLGGEIIPLGTAFGTLERGQVRIADDDFDHGIFNFELSEYVTNENSITAEIWVIRTNGNYGTVTVDYTTRTNSLYSTATSGVDYTAIRTGTLLFGDGETKKKFNVIILNNPEVEQDEVVSLVLSNATGGAKLPGLAPTSIASSVLTIVDDDFLAGRVQFTRAAYTNSEGDVSGALTVARTGGSLNSLTVNYTTINGSATAPADYAATSGSLTWNDGDSTAKTILVPLFGDGIVEGFESLQVRLSNPSILNALGSRTNASLWIADGDAFGTFSFSQSEYESDENGANPTITVVRSGGVAGPLSVDFATVPIIANPGIDYIPTNGTLVFQPGEFSKTFQVPLIDNSFPDGDRTLRLLLSNPVNGRLGAISNVLLNIVDNESINLPAGSLDTTFSSLAAANAAVYSLVQQTDGRIIMAGDFTQVSSIPRNHLARLLPNGVLDNTFDIGPGANGSIRALGLQSDGKLYIGGLFTSVNGTNRNGIARLATDGSVDAAFNPGSGADNPVFTLAVQPNDKVLLGGSFARFNGIIRPGLVRLNTNGTVDTAFNVSAGFNGSVYAIGLQNDGKVIVGGDFIAFNGVARTNILRLNANGSLDVTFNPTLAVDAAVRAILVEPDGRIVIGGSFTSINGVTRRHLARIGGDGVLDPSFLSNAFLGADNPVYAIKQQVDGRLLVAGDFHVFNGVTRNGITRLFEKDGGTDPTINFGNGANGFVAALLVQPDRRIVLGGGFTGYDDRPRQFIARIYGGSIAGAGSIEYSASTFAVSEGTTNAVIAVRRVGGTAGDVSVNFFTGTNGTAIVGLQYIPTNGVLNFPTGETRLLFTVPLISNNIADGNRTVSLLLSNFVGVAAGPQPSSSLVIVDDETTVEFLSPYFTANESSGSGTVTVVRRGGTNTTANVNITTLNGSATAGLDYVATNFVITFAPGELAKNFAVGILDDLLTEGNETFSLVLSNPSGTTGLGISIAMLTINDNDFGPGGFLFATNNFVVDEFAGVAGVTILRTNGSLGSVQIRFMTSDGTAVNSQDYVGTNQLITFGEGETSKTVTFPVINDAVTEPDETVNLTLSQPTGGATILQNSAIVTIADDEFSTSYVGFPTNRFVVSEAGGFATITVTRTNNRRGLVEVDFAVANGTATVGTDYILAGGTLTFLDNEVSKTFTIPILNDILSEGDETVLLSLSNARSTETTVFLGLANSTLVILDRAVPVAGNVDSGYAGNFGANAAVHSVAFDSAQRLLIGGEFTQVYGLAANRVARMTTNGAADYSFQIGNGVENTVFAVAAANNVIIGTNLTFSTNVVVTEDETNIVVVTNTFIVGTNVVEFVETITITNNGTVNIISTNSSLAFGAGNYIGGAFTNVNGANSPRVARLNDNGSVDLQFNVGTGANGIVRTVTPYGSHLLVAGDFTTFDGRPARRVVRLNNNGSYDTNFDSSIGANGSVRAVAVQPDGQIIIGGDFSTVNGVSTPRLARLQANGALDVTFNLGDGADDIVRTVAVQPDGKIIVGGSFFTFNGVPRAHLVRLNVDGTVDLTFDTGSGFAGGDVRSVALQSDGKVLAVGSFTGVSGNPINRIARLNTDGSLDTFFAVGTGANAQVNSVATYVFSVPAVCLSTGLVMLDFEVFSATNFAGITNYATNCAAFFGPTGSVFHPVSNTVSGGTAAQLLAADGGLIEINLSGSPFSLFSINFLTAGPVLVTSSSGDAEFVVQSGFHFFGSFFNNVQWVRIQPFGGEVTLDDIQLFASPLPTPVSTDRIAVG